MLFRAIYELSCLKEGAGDTALIREETYLLHKLLLWKKRFKKVTSIYLNLSTVYSRLITHWNTHPHVHTHSYTLMQDKAVLQCKIKKSLEPFIIHCVEKNVPLNNYLKSKATSNKIKVRHSWIILLCCKSSVICTVWSPLFDMHLQYKRKGYYQLWFKLCHCLLLSGLGARNWSVRYGKP